jgi:type I restriction enzyme S subunit
MTEGPYKLPEGWRWVRLGEVALKPQYGYTTSAVTEAVGPKFLRITDISSGEIDWESVPYCSAAGKVLEKYKLRVGDVLFARSGSVGATVVIRETPPDAVFASYLIRVRLREEVLPEYAEWLLKAPVSQSQLVPQGAAQKNINARHIEQVLIPLPHLEEQRRIVGRIEELMGRVREARRLRQEAQKDAERLWQSVLAQTFPRPGSNLPEGWRWVRLGEVCTLIEVGFAFRKNGTPEGDLLHLRPYNIGEDGTLVLSQRFYLPSSLGSARHKMPQPGDVLFNNTNSVELVGKTALVREPLEAAFSNHITLLRSDTTKAQGAWIALALQALWRQGFFANLCNKWIGQAGINTETLKSVLISLPPLEEQRRIVADLQAVQEKIQAFKEAQAATEAELRRLEQAILEKAFRGEL